MTSAVRSVRFSDDLPRVSHNSTAGKKLIESYEETPDTPIQLPRVYDDALYSPYDVYTAASIGDIPVIQVYFFIIISLIILYQMNVNSNNLNYNIKINDNIRINY